MFSGKIDPATSEEAVARLERRLERERKARREAEALAEKGLRELYQREREISVVASIATAANLSGSLGEAFNLALSEIGALTGWPVAHAYLRRVGSGDGEDMLHSSDQWYLAEEDPGFENFRAVSMASDLDLGTQMVGRVCRTGEPVWLDSWHDVEMNARAIAARAAGIGTACAVPVMLGEDVVAVLEFFHVKSIARDERMLELLRQAGIQLGRVVERKRSVEQLRHDALHDPLTGLANRALFLERLSGAIAHSVHDPRHCFAALFIDLDRFKIVNDSLGHLVGDRLLCLVAERLESFIAGLADAHPACTVARLGGDEFTVLLSPLERPAQALTIAGELLEALEQPFAIEGQTLHVGASIGVATGDVGYSCATEVLRDADLAMYRAKGTGKGRVELFGSELHSEMQQRLECEADLRQALADWDFVLHYQPIVRLADRRIAGFEALIRWQRANGEMISPADFIPVAEEIGLIIPMGERILEEACYALVRLQRAHPDSENPLWMSVNVSPSQFLDPQFPARVERVIAETGVDPSCLSLEITEGVTVADVETTFAMLNRLKALGVRISVDDFGTGYSSLSYLQQFPLDTLKIDRSFVDGMTVSEDNRKIVNTIMSLAQGLQMAVVAEGAEVWDQVSELEKLGCEYGQGFVFSRPVDEAAVLALLDSADPPAGQGEAAAMIGQIAAWARGAG